MSYIGDKAFISFLEKIKFPCILPEIKAVILRHIWSINMARMPLIIDEMKGDYRFKTVEIAQEFFNNFMALWNLIGEHQEGNYFRFAKFSKIETKKELLTRIFIRDCELRALRPLLLDEAKDVPDRHKQEFQAIVAQINPAIEEMKIILGSAAIPFEKEKLAEWETKLDGLDIIIEEAINRLGWMLVKIRRNGISEKTTAKNPNKNVGRNDLCPCGSGKKFKKCCWARMN